MATIAEDFRWAYQDVVAPDLKIIAQDIRELKEIVKSQGEDLRDLKEIVKSQGTGFYAALHGLNQKIDDVRDDVLEIKAGIKKNGQGKRGRKT